MIEKPPKHWTGAYWSISEKPFREENLDFSFSFTKHDYENLVNLADEILNTLKDKKTLRMADVFSILTYRCPFCSSAIKCVFALTIRKAIHDENRLIVFYPIINPSDSCHITVTDFELRLTEIPQSGPLSTAPKGGFNL